MQLKGRVAPTLRPVCAGLITSVFWSLISGLSLTYANQSCVLLSFSDISAQIERESTLRHLASTDPLTGVYNRRYFF